MTSKYSTKAASRYFSIILPESVTGNVGDLQILDEQLTIFQEAYQEIQILQESIKDVEEQNKSRVTENTSRELGNKRREEINKIREKANEDIVKLNLLIEKQNQEVSPKLKQPLQKLIPLLEMQPILKPIIIEEIQEEINQKQSVLAESAQFIAELTQTPEITVEYLIKEIQTASLPEIKEIDAESNLKKLQAYKLNNVPSRHVQRVQGIDAWFSWDSMHRKPGNHALTPLQYVRVMNGKPEYIANVRTLAHMSNGLLIPNDVPTNWTPAKIREFTRNVPKVVGKIWKEELVLEWRRKSIATKRIFMPKDIIKQVMEKLKATGKQHVQMDIAQLIHQFAAEIGTVVTSEDLSLFDSARSYWQYSRLVESEVNVETQVPKIVGTQDGKLLIDWIFQSATKKTIEPRHISDKNDYFYRSNVDRRDELDINSISQQVCEDEIQVIEVDGKKTFLKEERKFQSGGGIPFLNTFQFAPPAKYNDDGTIARDGNGDPIHYGYSPKPEFNIIGKEGGWAEQMRNRFLKDLSDGAVHLCRQIEWEEQVTKKTPKYSSPDQIFLKTKMEPVQISKDETILVAFHSVLNKVIKYQAYRIYPTKIMMRNAQGERVTMKQNVLLFCDVKPTSEAALIDMESHVGQQELLREQAAGALIGPVGSVPSYVEY